MQIKKASRSLTYVKILLTGPSGSGKSMSALTLATGMTHKIPDTGGNSTRIGYIGSESGRDELYADRFDYDLISLDEKDKTVRGYSTALDMFVKNGYKIIIIDSLSHLWDEVIDEVSKAEKSKKYKTSITNWAENKKPNKKFLQKILSTEAHIICTARGKDQYIVENENGRNVFKKVGVGAQQDKDAEYEFMISFLLDQKTHRATATKDNTMIYDFSYSGEESHVLTEIDGEKIMEWAVEGRPEEWANLEKCRELKNKIIETAKEKGGESNQIFTEKYREIFPQRSIFNNCKDAELLEEALRELSEIDDLKTIRKKETEARLEEMEAAGLVVDGEPEEPQIEEPPLIEPVEDIEGNDVDPETGEILEVSDHVEELKDE